MTQEVGFVEAKVFCREHALSPRHKLTRSDTTRCGQSRHLASTYLSRRERESICDGSREWRCCGTIQSPSTITMPSQNHPTRRQTSESTMLQEVSIMHTKTQEGGASIRPIEQKKSEATNRLLEVTPCSACTTRIPV